MSHADCSLSMNLLMQYDSPTCQSESSLNREMSTILSLHTTSRSTGVFKSMQGQQRSVETVQTQELYLSLALKTALYSMTRSYETMQNSTGPHTSSTVALEQ